MAYGYYDDYDFVDSDFDDYEDDPVEQRKRRRSKAFYDAQGREVEEAEYQRITEERNRQMAEDQQAAEIPPLGVSNGINEQISQPAYDETQRRAQALIAQGQPVDQAATEQIYNEVISEQNPQLNFGNITEGEPVEGARSFSDGQDPFTVEEGSYGKIKQNMLDELVGSVYNLPPEEQIGVLKAINDMENSRRGKAPTAKAIAETEQIQLENKAFIRESNRNLAYEEAEGSGLQVERSEKGRPIRATGLISKNGWKVGNASLGNIGYELVGEEAMYKDNTWPAANEMGFNVTGIRKIRKTKSESKKKKTDLGLSGQDIARLADPAEQERLRSIHTERGGLSGGTEPTQPQGIERGFPFTSESDQGYGRSGKPPYDQIVDWLARQRAKSQSYYDRLNQYGTE